VPNGMVERMSGWVKDQVESSIGMSYLSFTTSSSVSARMKLSK
jgi:hypothetical protein